MNLKKLVFIEVGSVVVIVVLALIFLAATPLLASSQQNTSIGLYNQRQFDAGNVTITRDSIVDLPRFNYTTFDPAILVIELNFQSWVNNGNLTVDINGKPLGTVFASPETPHTRLTTISFSGSDIVEPTSYYSPLFGNTIYFSSDREGFEGTFTYEIAIRGSR